MPNVLMRIHTPDVRRGPSPKFQIPRNALNSAADLSLAAHPDQYYERLNSRLFHSRTTNLTQCRFRLKKFQGCALPSFQVSGFEVIFLRSKAIQSPARLLQLFRTLAECETVLGLVVNPRLGRKPRPTGRARLRPSRGPTTITERNYSGLSERPGFCLVYGRQKLELSPALCKPWTPAPQA